MLSMTRPKRRQWAWLFAIAYLLGSMSPSLALPFAAGLRGVVAQHTEQSKALVGCHEHHHAGAEPAQHLLDVAVGADIDERSGGPRHSSCCGSLCFSAAPPQPTSILQLPMPRFRCESEPALKFDEGTRARRYRPPIV